MLPKCGSEVLATNVGNLSASAGPIDTWATVDEAALYSLGFSMVDPADGELTEWEDQTSIHARFKQNAYKQMRFANDPPANMDNTRNERYQLEKTRQHQGTGFDPTSLIR